MNRFLFLLMIAATMGLQSCQYNAMVEKQEAVTAQWAQVENVYQRRADLIPNLVATVKGYADFEQETLTAVIEARAKATGITVDPTNLDANSIKQFQAAQDGLSSALSKLMVVVERYPDLKANQNFNETAQAYNTYIRKFPNNLIAGMFDFEKKEYFEADAGAEKAPKVEF